MQLRVVVDSRLRFSLSEVESCGLLDELKNAFEHDNPQYLKLRRMGLPAWKEPVQLITWKVEGSTFTLPRGGTTRVRRIVKEAGHSVLFVDQRTPGEMGGWSPLPKHNVRLWAHQQASIEAMLLKENCIIRSTTGSGKTTSGLAFAAQVRVPTIILVWSLGLLDQWRTRAMKEFGLPASEIGIIKGGKRVLRPITVAMQQTIKQQGLDEELEKTFGCVICDEIQRSPANTMFSSIDIWPARYRIGISADERRKDRKEALCYDLFGKIAHEVTREELVELGIILDVAIEVVPTTFAAPWYTKSGSSKFDDDDSGDQTGKRTGFTRLLDEITVDVTRQNQIHSIIMEAVRSGEQVLVLSRRRAHCEAIDRRVASMGVRTGLLLGGEENKLEFDRTLDGLRSGDVRVGVGTIEAVGTGTDLPTVGVAVATVPIAGNQFLFGQVCGRVCRTSKGKKGAKLVYLMDERIYQQRHFKNLAAWNKKVTVQQGDQQVPVRDYLKRK